VKRRRLIIPAVFVAVAVVWWWLRPRPNPVVEAYVSERSVTLQSSLAEVKEPLATLHYGQKVAVLERRGDQVRVRTAQGVSGWVEAHALVEPSLWERGSRLIAETRAMPVQAQGHTRVTSNLRIEPARAAARIYQFNRGVPVEVVARAVTEWSAPSEESPAPARESSEDKQTPRREDWCLVRGLATGSSGPGRAESVAAKGDQPTRVAGWVLARFIELDLPGPVRDNAASAALRVVAWFELNRVADAAGEKPQYLVAGTRGGEGQPCDFKMIRVYTWGARRQRYETAFVESNFCGHLPIRMGKSAGGDLEFRFSAVGKNGNEERLYQFRQTVVRRVRDDQKSSTRPHRPPHR